MSGVYVVGVGMTAFSKPGGSIDYPELCKDAVEQALRDAGLQYDMIQQACVGYVYGDSTSGLIIRIDQYLSRTKSIVFGWIIGDSGI